MADEKKRRRGRPSLHGPASVVLSVRAEKTLASRITGLLSAIKLADRSVNASDASVLVEALDIRLQQLANQSPNILKLAELK